MLTTTATRNPILHLPTGLDSLDRINAETDARNPLVAIYVPTSRVPGGNRTCSDCKLFHANWRISPRQCVSSDDRTDICTQCFDATYRAA